MKTFGFAVVHLTQQMWPATLEDGVYRCYDLSGFMGAHEPKGEVTFFHCPEGDILNEEVMRVANQFALQMKLGETMNVSI